VSELAGPPLGARFDGAGTRFALCSAHATEVELCLFDPARPGREAARLSLDERVGDVWHRYVPGCRPGTRYGYRVHGPWDPARGHRFDSAKLLIDPWTFALDEAPVWSESWLGADAAGGRSHFDSGPFVPRSVVVDLGAEAPPGFGDDRPPRVPWADTVLYECHVKGMSARHPEVPPALRGRYLGLASEPVVEHLKRLGVTTLSLLPIHQSAPDRHLAERRRPNYWGYSTLAFFAPDVRFASAPGATALREMREMVAALHRAGLEVLIDVVYNHTCEGGDDGTTLSFRGIDNASWYRLRPEDPARYDDVTGCGNTLDVRQPIVRRLVLESLRHFATELHVDGFRFDLAPTLGRDGDHFVPRGRLIEAILLDPVLSRLKLVVEPWDLGPSGHQLGAFPPGFAEWNDRYRDGVRRFWRGDAGRLADFASRLAGSSDVFGPARRPPHTSINFVACHDGFTLRDLVAYERKHNESNGEENRDGADENHSWSHGVEGGTSDPAVLAARAQSARSLLASLAFSLGTPMLGHGDELGRSQGGNNNAYCHDDETTWIDWAQADQGLLSFVTDALRLRRECPAFRRLRHLTGAAAGRGGAPDAIWLHAEGRELTEADWVDAALQVAGLVLTGEPDHLLLVNAGPDDVRFVLPAPATGHVTAWWRALLSSAGATLGPMRGESVPLPARSLLWLRRDAPRGAA